MYLEHLNVKFEHSPFRDQFERQERLSGYVCLGGMGTFRRLVSEDKSLFHIAS